PLPAGLTLNVGTGVISGTPTQASPPLVHQVTAHAYAPGTGQGGSGDKEALATARVTIEVVHSLVPPSGLTYSSPQISYELGKPIVANRPSLSGGVAESFSIEPALSAGLVLDAATGVLSGTPTQLSPTTRYTVTARNA